jgi:hypothetical protein
MTAAELLFRLAHKFDREQLEDFAVPYSRQERGIDGDGHKVTDQEFIWDYYDCIAPTGERVRGQWYLDFVCRLTEGKNITDVRRKALANNYRKAMQLYRQWIKIEDALGSKTDHNDNLIPGKVSVNWVYADENNQDLRLAQTKYPIRISQLDAYGNLSGLCSDLSVKWFLNLSVDQAIINGCTYVALIDSRKAA